MMRGPSILSAVWALACPSHPATSATLHAWQDTPSPESPYATRATGARNIQDTVNAAAAGDEIVVANGIYATGGRWAWSFG